MSANHRYIVYRIYYGDLIVYVGRTKQPLQSRIRGHLFSKPMHRTIFIEQVSRIEYTEMETEADMNLMELYYILKLKPPLNVDDKAPDALTLSLPEVDWKVFQTPLWEKWKHDLQEQDGIYERNLKRYRQIAEERRILRSRLRMGELTEDQFEELARNLETEFDDLKKKLGR